MKWCPLTRESGKPLRCWHVIQKKKSPKSLPTSEGLLRMPPAGETGSLQQWILTWPTQTHDNKLIIWLVPYVLDLIALTICFIIKLMTCWKMFGILNWKKLIKCQNSLMTKNQWCNFLILHSHTRSKSKGDLNACTVCRNQNRFMWIPPNTHRGTNMYSRLYLLTRWAPMFSNQCLITLHEPEGMLVSLQSRVVKLEDSLTHCANKVPHYCNI